jgi:ankyrin repeat protein
MKKSAVLFLLTMSVLSSKIDDLLKANENGLQWKNKVQLAVRDGKVSDLKTLLADRSDEINAPCCGRGTAMSPLQFACKEGNAKSTEALVELGADLNFIHEDTKTTPLMFAAREGSTDALRALLFSNTGHSPLQKPQLHSNWGPATLDAIDEHGNTALLLAATLGHAEIAQLLLSAGANGLVTNKMGNNAWQIAAFYCSGGRSFIDTIFKFVPHDHVDDQAPNGRNALMLAASGGQLDCLQALLENGAIVEVKSAADSQTAQEISEAKGHTQITAALRKAAEHREL